MRERRRHRSWREIRWRSPGSVLALIAGLVLLSSHGADGQGSQPTLLLGDGIPSNFGSQYTTLQPNLTIVAIIHGLGPTDPSLVANVTKAKVQNASLNVVGTGTTAVPKTNTTGTAGSVNITAANVTVTSSNKTAGPQWTAAEVGSSFTSNCTFAAKVALLLTNPRISLILFIDNSTSVFRASDTFARSLNSTTVKNPDTTVGGNVSLAALAAQVPIVILERDGGARVVNLLRNVVGGNGEGKADTSIIRTNNAVPPTTILFSILLPNAASIISAPTSADPNSLPTTTNLANMSLYHNAFFISAVVLSVLSVAAFGIALWRRRQMQLRYRRARALFAASAAELRNLGFAEDVLRTLTPSDLTKYPVTIYLGDPSDAKSTLQRPASSASRPISPKSFEVPHIVPAASPREKEKEIEAGERLAVPLVPIGTLERKTLGRTPTSEPRMSVSSWTSRSGHPVCPVCLDPFVPGVSMVRTLPCNHVFHSDCIDRWLLERACVCPICRLDLAPPPPGPDSRSQRSGSVSSGSSDGSVLSVSLRSRAETIVRGELGSVRVPSPAYGSGRGEPPRSPISMSVLGSLRLMSRRTLSDVGLRSPSLAPLSARTSTSGDFSFTETVFEVRSRFGTRMSEGANRRRSSTVTAQSSMLELQSAVGSSAESAMSFHVPSIAPSGDDASEKGLRVVNWAETLAVLTTPVSRVGSSASEVSGSIVGGGNVGGVMSPADVRASVVSSGAAESVYPTLSGAAPSTDRSPLGAARTTTPVSSVRDSLASEATVVPGRRDDSGEEGLRFPVPTISETGSAINQRVSFLSPLDSASPMTPDTWGTAGTPLPLPTASLLSEPELLHVDLPDEDLYKVSFGRSVADNVSSETIEGEDRKPRS
ncbi:hypothetical protein M427DRAFT_32015 [Gonapodya prolifera JEL478]|uniref:RING-type domain-containing protein n=1 Tax=Gonapodya prolifera (strain JEL478) TaxID=1344416 RepID=A0A139AGA8_GONPJ|nr:hypothetical protein M427DRAFT_32015 [Gonapodya prolifera JEL478]|eukprot:KXS15841.1 hypothetical protein M427DRAFT_32015 [Gonapodya prolifera JEL478]